MTFTLRGARLVDATQDIPAGDLALDGARIAAVGPAGSQADGAAEDTPGGVVVDVADMVIVPGFIDVHTHGGGGCNLHTDDPAEILRYARWATSTGVTSFLVGVVGTPNALPEAQLRAAVQAVAQARAGEETGGETGAEPLGIHLEGPYINERRRGAHLPSWLRAPSLAESERILELADGCLRIITLAPELPGAAAMIQRMLEAGVTVSIGHTDATYEQALAAIAQGATQMTHCCNGMRPLHHRDPGPIGALARDTTIRGEIIVDGVHVHPAMVNILVDVLGPERTIVITDAQSAAGLADVTFEFAGQPAHVENGVAKLADGTITGSVLTMDQALRNVLGMAPLSLSAAVGMLTRNPARAAGSDDRKGLLQPGGDADLVLLDATLHVQATICRGRVAYASEAWRERLGLVSAPDAASPAPTRKGTGRGKRP